MARATRSETGWTAGSAGRRLPAARAACWPPALAPAVPVRAGRRPAAWLPPGAGLRRRATGRAVPVVPTRTTPPPTMQRSCERARPIEVADHAREAVDGFDRLARRLVEGPVEAAQPLLPVRLAVAHQGVEGAVDAHQQRGQFGGLGAGF